jgi:hypothetical protein
MGAYPAVDGKPVGIGVDSTDAAMAISGPRPILTIRAAPRTPWEKPIHNQKRPVVLLVRLIQALRLHGPIRRGLLAVCVLLGRMALLLPS